MNHPHRTTHKRRGFTIVELVIVIAVIGILATVLVPTFGDVIQNANQAKDIQTAKNMNTALSVYGATMSEEPAGNSLIQDIDDVMDALAQAGFDTAKELTPACKDHSFYWYRTTGQIVYVNEQKDDFELVYPKGISGFPHAKDDSFFRPADEVVRSSYAGKKVSILGDSISTYTGVSNSTAYNSTISKNAVYYKDGKCDVYQADTWWQQVIDALDMELCVNNSWSGSKILASDSSGGAYGKRCINLHNDHTNEQPDIIIVFMGTNDYNACEIYRNTSTHLGTASSIDYDTLIRQNADGTFAYTTPKTVCEAYSIMLHKIQQTYPNAQVYCLNQLRRPEAYNTYTIVQPVEFNKSIEAIVNHFGFHLVDLYSLISAEDVFDHYIYDNWLHPGKYGMDLMSEAVISAMLGEDAALCKVSGNYTGVKTDRPGPSALLGYSYTASLTLLPDYEKLSVTVTMDGKDITASCYANGKISIPGVTGDISITAQAMHDFKTMPTYLWEIKDGALTSTGAASNHPTLKQGSISGNTIKNAHYTLATTVDLKHDEEWVIEWRAKGNWSGMLFSSHPAEKTAGMTYLFHSKTAGTMLLAFGQYTSSQYHNYGLPLASITSDMGTAYHTYRLENKIADGHSMVSLYIDNTACGSMDHYYIGGSTNKNQQKSEFYQKDLSFSCIGATSGQLLTDLTLDYLAVWENGIN